MSAVERTERAGSVPGPSDGLTAISALAEPTRRALYEYVATAGTWVSRDGAADAVGLERGTAAHHLDRLAADGLLDVEYRRLSGRQGPGAGRPAKLYRRAARDVDVTLPPRDYGMVARLLAAAIERSRLDGDDIVTALETVTTDEGGRWGEEMRSRLAAGDDPGVTARRVVLRDLLARHGYEPHDGPSGTIVLQNCPFHQIASRFTELVCGINRSLLSTAIADFGGTDLDAELDPQPGACCVVLRPRRERSIDNSS